MASTLPRRAALTATSALLVAASVSLSGCLAVAAPLATAGGAAIAGGIASDTAAGATKGTNFDEKRVQEIVKGKTTEMQLVEMFGNPDQTGMSGDGKNLMWKRQDAASSGGWFGGYKMDVKMKMLMVQLDRKGIVKDFTFNQQ